MFTGRVFEAAALEYIYIFNYNIYEHGLQEFRAALWTKFPTFLKSTSIVWFINFYINTV